MGKERSKVDPNRQRQHYNGDFKLEAVRLLELGIRRNMLYKWQRELSGKGETAFPGRGRKQQTEIEQLKAELKKVTEERDILKKAAAYFAKELK